MAERTLDLGGLQALLERVRGLKVACVGDLMLDRYVYGEVSRISPEAPIPVLRARGATAMPGGVGNVARNVAALGGVALLGAVAGKDAAGDELAALIAAEPGDENAIERRDGVTTIGKTLFVANGQQLLRLDDEAPAVMGEGSEAFSGASVILLSDYAKGVISDLLLGEALAAARDSGAPVVV